MYLHLGQNAVTPVADIIGLFDLEKTSQSNVTKNFLTQAQKEGLVETTSDELPASFLLCQRDGKTKVYLSQITVTTLTKRFNRRNLTSHF
jgi:hypothetical protein